MSEPLPVGVADPGAGTERIIVITNNGSVYAARAGTKGPPAEWVKLNGTIFSQAKRKGAVAQQT